MPFPIDVARPFRYPSELQRLSTAVRDAGGYDETLWIEWKSRLDLESQHARIHLVKQILGFANRDPAVARKWAEGYAYLLVGVSPGKVHGINEVDPQRLQQTLGPYLGSELKWHPEYIDLEDSRVLIIIIDPPLHGDPIRFLQRDLLQPKGNTDTNTKSDIVHKHGTIFIRHPGEAAIADQAERDMLQRRLMASSHRLEMDLISDQTAIEATPDIEGDLSSIIESERNSRMAARHENPRASNRYPISDFFTDRRTREQYISEVDTYIDQLEYALRQRFEAEVATHSKANLTLTLANNTDHPYPISSSRTSFAFR